MAYTPRICPFCHTQTVLKSNEGHRVCELCAHDFDEPKPVIVWRGTRQTIERLRVVPA